MKTPKMLVLAAVTLIFFPLCASAQRESDIPDIGDMRFRIVRHALPPRPLDGKILSAQLKLKHNNKFTRVSIDLSGDSFKHSFEDVAKIAWDYPDPQFRCRLDGDLTWLNGKKVVFMIRPVLISTVAEVKTADQQSNQSNTTFVNRFSQRPLIILEVVGLELKQ